MGLPDRPSARSLRIAKRGALGLLGLQAGVVAGLGAVDFVRKRVRPPRTDFPRTEPTSVGVGESELTVYTYGTSLYDDMIDAIERAKSVVLLESFIVKADEVGQRFKRALIEAAQRGVEVFVIYDGFANLVVSPRFFAFPEGVEVLRYPALKPGMLAFDVRKSGRDHRKLLIVDGQVGFVGGYNIGAAYATQWRDTHLRITGPSVWGLENAFSDFWAAHAAPGQRCPQTGGSSEWEARVRVHRNLPSQLVYPIRSVYLEAIDRACHRISITQPYFIPDSAMVRGLLDAVARGVSVRVLVPATSNHVVCDWLSRGLYDTLLRGGVELWRYQDAMIHAKTMTIDGEWSTVGTANIDRLSLTGNYEVNVEVFDAGLATHLDAVFATDLTNAERLEEQEWAQRGAAPRLGELLLAPLRPLL